MDVSGLWIIFRKKTHFAVKKRKILQLVVDKTCWKTIIRLRFSSKANGRIVLSARTEVVLEHGWNSGVVDKSTQIKASVAQG